MESDIFRSLSYRDLVVYIFTGLLFNLFLWAALWPILPVNFWEYDLQNEVIWSLIAIPVLFLEGHFILAVDRLLFVEIPQIISVKYKKERMANKAKAFKECRRDLKTNCSFLFYLLFGKRITGQITIQDKQSKQKIESENSITDRYYILSDFFKGIGCSAWVALFVALYYCNWCVLFVLLAIIVLSWLRTRFYSSLYVRKVYKKK